MAKAWGGAGAWAADLERAEAEEKERQRSGLAGIGEPDNFPSLREASASKPKKKNKGQTLSLSELATGVYVGAATKGLTTDELMRLPTGPRERSGEEAELGRLGGAFRDYRRNSRPEREPRDRGFGGGFGRERDGGDGQWGSNRRASGGFGDDRKFSRAGEYDRLSRADEADNWASGKRFIPSNSFSGNRRDAFDNWSAGKKFALGGGERRFGAPEHAGTDRWGKRDVYSSTDRGRDRPRIFLNPPSRTRTDSPPPPLPSTTAPMSTGGAMDAPRTRPNPFGSARPRETVLAERGQDWRKLDSELDSRSSIRPASGHSSRPTSAHSSRSGSLISNLEIEVVEKPRPKINPFGEARPREILLEEKGKDWRKIDFELEHRGIDRPETEEELKLKEEINSLKELAKETISSDEVKVNINAFGEISIEENQKALREQIILKEKQLERLIRELDDKVRFGQKKW